MTDQHRADWVGAYGADYARTPTLDRLASEGVRFTQCATVCPVCMPARTSFLTGMYPHNHGMWHNVGRLQDPRDTYLHPLLAAGYRTGHVGKSHLHPHGRGRDLRDSEPYMHALGFDDVLECTGPLSTQTTKSILTDWMEAEGIYETFLADYKRRAEAAPKQALWPSPLPDGKHADDFITNTAVDYIAGSDNRQPLCLFVGLGGPHNPWDPPERFDTYRPEDMPAPLPPDPAPEWLTGPALEHHARMMNHNGCVTPEEWARLRTLYSARVEHVDYCMGRVLEAWAYARGDDSWVLFWSDHGEMLGDKSRVAKCVFYNASLRVPAIVRPPNGLSRAVVCDGLVSTTDLTATVLDMAECELPVANVFGTSLLPALDEPDRVGASLAVSEIDDRTMVFDGRWKMVINDRDELLKLFDTREDPEETLNLAGRSDAAAEADRLRHELLEFLLRTQYRQHRDVNG